MDESKKEFEEWLSKSKKFKVLNDDTYNEIQALKALKKKIIRNGFVRMDYPRFGLKDVLYVPLSQVGVFFNYY